MKLEEAEKTALIAQQSSIILDSHLNYLKEVLDEDEFKVMCKKVGKVMGEAYFQILDPIWKEFPELLPEQMGGNYKVDKGMHKDFQELVKKYAYKNL